MNQYIQSTSLIIGPADNLSMAQIVALLTDEETENFLSVGRLTGFANFIDSDSVDRVVENFEKVSVDRDKKYSEVEEFGDEVRRLFSFDYLPGEIFDTVTLKVE